MLAAEAFAIEPVQSGGIGDEKSSAVAIDYNVTIASDRYEWGLNEVDHGFSAEMSLAAHYGAAFARIWAANSNVSEEVPDAEVKATIGLMPRWNDWTFTMIVSRDEYVAAPDRSYTYLMSMATYTFDGGLSAGLAHVYYWWGRTVEFHEAYLRLDYAPRDGLAFALDAVHDFNYDGLGNDYIELIGAADVRLTRRLGLSGEIGLEHYYTSPVVPSFYWYSAGAYILLGERVKLGLHYYGNNLSREGCAILSTNDCESRVVASLSVSGNFRLFGSKP